jgi:hypothetical protein
MDNHDGGSRVCDFTTGFVTFVRCLAVCKGWLTVSSYVVAGT